MTRKNWLLGAFALVALGLLAAVVLIALKPATPAPVSQGKRSAESVLGQVGDILDNKTQPGIPLATARARAADGILIPSSKMLGKATKVSLTEAEAPRELVGIAILYDSGVKFFATPSGDKNKTFDSSILPKFKNIPMGSFTDGRKQAYDVVEVGGRKYMVFKGGTQKFGELTHEVKPTVIFLVDGIEYRLIAASGDLKEKDLLKVAQEMH